MSTSWDQIHLKLLKLKEDVVNQSKRALKKEIPKSELTRQEIQDTLLKLFNDTTKYISAYWPHLDNTQKSAVKAIFLIIRDKVVRSFQTLNVNYKVPSDCLEQIDPLVFEEQFTSEENLVAMAMSNVEFLNFASKILPQEFDGSPGKLQSFIDALTLLNANSNDQTANAVAFVKTRLTGKARDIITSEGTLVDIINSLRNGIKGDNSQLLTAKILNLKQKHRDAVIYATEIESLADDLKRAFISEGVPYAVAERYSTEHVVRSLSKNANSEKTQIVMEAGTFNTVRDAITKFVNVDSNSQASTSNVLFFRQNSRGYGRNNNNNNRGRGQNYNNYDQRQNNRGRRGRGNYNNRYNGNNGYRVNYQRNNYTRAVRATGLNTEAGNESDPQQVRLGEKM